jgi:hypothetical protein
MLNKINAFLKAGLILMLTAFVFSCTVANVDDQTLNVIEKSNVINDKGYHSFSDLYFDYNEYGPYGNPILGLNIKYYKNGTYVTSKQIQSGYKQIMNIYWSGIDEGSWELVLNETKEGVTYKGRVTFIISSLTPSSTKTMAITTQYKKMVHYYSTKAAANIHYKQDNGQWTAVPGVAMYKDSYTQPTGWFYASVPDSGDLTFCFNDNAGNWDSKNGANYYTTAWEIWVKDGVIYDKAPVDKVVFQVSIDKYKVEKDGYIVEVRGSKAPLSWTAGIQLSTITYGLTENTYSGSIDIAGSFDYKYVIKDVPTGRVLWEILPNNGNRAGQMGKLYTETAQF